MFVALEMLDGGAEHFCCITVKSWLEFQNDCGFYGFLRMFEWLTCYEKT